MGLFSKVFKRILGQKSQEDRRFEKQVREDGVEYVAKRIAEQLNQKISSETLAKVYILEELDSARGGNEFSKNFVKNSGFNPNEYIGAMRKTKWEGEESELEHLQLFSRQFLEKIEDIDLKVKLAIAILDEVMQKWKMGKYGNNEFVHNEDKKILEVNSKEEDFINNLMDLYSIDEYDDPIKVLTLLDENNLSPEDFLNIVEEEIIKGEKLLKIVTGTNHKGSSNLMFFISKENIKNMVLELSDSSVLSILSSQVHTLEIIKTEAYIDLEPMFARVIESVINDLYRLVIVISREKNYCKVNNLNYEFILGEDENKIEMPNLCNTEHYHNSFKENKNDSIHTITLTKDELNNIRSLMSTQNTMLLAMVEWYKIELLDNKQEEIILEIINLSNNIINNDSWDNDFFGNDEVININLTEEQIYVIYSIYLMNDDMKKLVSVHSDYSSYVEKFKKIIDGLEKNNDDNVVLHPDTMMMNGLMWQTEMLEEEMEWEDAMEYAENLRLGGYNNWRLATIDEFREVIDFCGGTNVEYEGNNENNTSYQKCYKSKGFISNLYWSSTSSVDGAWCVSFNDGNTDIYLNFISKYVRCVRSI